MMQGMEGLSRVRVTEQRFVLDDEALRDLRDLGDRLAGARVGLDLGSGWERGVPSGWLRALLEDWRDFATDALQLRFDRLRQLRADVHGHGLHLVHVQGQGPNPLPLLLTHGWPGSFLEYSRLVPLLSDPGEHGPDPADAFTVIVPSLPGYGFSDLRPASARWTDRTRGRAPVARADERGAGL